MESMHKQVAQAKRREEQAAPKAIKEELESDAHLWRITIAIRQVQEWKD